jgi:hypothetical protein
MNVYQLVLTKHLTLITQINFQFTHK